MKVIPEGSSAMPGKSDDERTIVAVVCWPPSLHGDGDSEVDGNGDVDGDGYVDGDDDVFFVVGQMFYLTCCHQFLQVFTNCRKI